MNSNFFKIKYVILAVITFLCLISALAVGYDLGVGKAIAIYDPSYDGSITNNLLTSLIASSNLISAIASVFTLIFLVVMRDDWLKPKTTEVILLLKVALSRWDFSRKNLNFIVYPGVVREECFKSSYLLESERVKAHKDKLEVNIKEEETVWKELDHLFESYKFYFPKPLEIISLINAIQLERSKCNLDTKLFLKKLENLQSYDEINAFKFTGSKDELPEFKKLQDCLYLRN